ncbi:hypothetical protein NEIRO03_0585 [Nematocida sp. AWRm78]|nr:hypothetical protein NEIRO02_0550 [Nematocida sp. AWRm79]KAI5182950.1 hypothetical protein NEIRO03_0585 [Nematocida sp. AWRm78]
MNDTPKNKKSNFMSGNTSGFAEMATLLDKSRNNGSNPKYNQYEHFYPFKSQNDSRKLSMETTFQNNSNLPDIRNHHRQYNSQIDIISDDSNEDVTMTSNNSKIWPFTDIKKKTSRRKRIQKAILVFCMSIIALLVISIFMIFIIHLFSPNITERLNISPFIPDSVDKLSKKIDIIKKFGISSLNATSTSEVTTMLSTSDLPITSSIKDILTTSTTTEMPTTISSTIPTSTAIDNSELYTTTPFESASTILNATTPFESASTTLNATYAINA